MIEMSLQNLSELLDDSSKPTPEISFQGVAIDSRKHCSGRLFIAIRGDRLDGHDYVESAISKWQPLTRYWANACEDTSITTNSHCC